MSANYLETPIIEAKQTDMPNYGVTRLGYTLRSGAPTSYMVRLEGDKVWRRVMAWQFSNAGTIFVRVLGEALIIRDEYQIRQLASS